MTFRCAVNRIKFTRDLMVACSATAAFLFEVGVGGGRPAVLTACVSLLLSPLVMRVDEARRGKNGKHRADEAKGNSDAAP